MGERKIYKEIDEIYAAVREDDLSKAKLLMKQSWDLSSQYKKEGNIISVAIEYAGVEVLAEIMGIDYSLKDEIIVLDRKKYKLLNSPCYGDGLTPLMKSASCGRSDVVSFLIACGAEVNAETQRNETALDFSLHQADSNVTLRLLKADATFSKFTRSREGKYKLNAIIAQNKELQEFFDQREYLHNALKEKRFDAEIEAAFEVENSLYYINKDGESALWQAACNLNFEAWAYLNDKGVKCTSKSEMKEVEVAKLSYEDNFNQSLVKYYFHIKGAHVMKMVSKAKVFRKKRQLEDLSGKVDSFFKALDQNEMTSLLLKVLQDEHDLDVVFDFDSSNLEYVHPNCYGNVWGKSDEKRTRIYISALENESYTSVDVIQTLAHELALLAISLVFENHGKPYRKDSEEEREYKEILKEVMKDECFQNCDDIIKRVSKFDEEEQEQELIVGVPEMMVKYQEEGSKDGVDRLMQQAPRLLYYYEKYVMQAFELYVKNNFPYNRMTVKMMSEYQKLLNAAQSDQIDVCANVKDFDEHIYHYKGLAILRVSNMRLAHSHLRNVLQKRGHSLLMIKWSQLIKLETEFFQRLSNGSVGFLVVTWDLNDDPPLCRRRRCRGKNCIANILSGQLENVIVLLPIQFASLGKEPMQYKWMDLSEKTKELIFQKKLVFNGEETTVKKLITTVSNEEEEDFMVSYMCPSDVSYLLEEKKIVVGKAYGWSTDDVMSNSIFYHPDCYIKRSLHQGSVELKKFLIDEISSDIFLISGAAISELRNIGIFGQCVSTWNGSCDKDGIRCFVLDSSTGMDNEGMIFNEICCRYPMKNGIHHLKYKEGDLMYIKSSGSVKSLIKYMNYEVIKSSMEEEDFLHQHIHEKLLKADDHPDEILMPLIIADDPGSGKSFVLNSFATKLKNKFPDIWPAVIDLNFYAQSKSPVRLSELDSVADMNYDKIIDFLYKMVQQGNSSFERTIFTSFCKKRHKVVVMFDGFDEICPKYADSVLNYIKALVVNTSIKVIVTTRLHEKYDLETSLNSIAYKLVPFSNHEQTEFLNLYWNLSLRSLARKNRLNKIRKIRSSIERWLQDGDEVDITHAIQTLDGAILEAETMTNEDEDHNSKTINFDIYAKKVLRGIKILSKNVDQFMQTPLHIQMTGFIAFEEDFNIGNCLNLGHLYLRFFEIKMKIFDKEKVLSGENVSAENYSRMVRENSYGILEKLSANVFFEPSCYKFKKDSMESSLSVGLVAVRKEIYQFVHRTFGEFFFARWLLRKSKKVHVTRFWLDELFAKDGLLRVRCFLDDILYVQSMAVSPSEDDYSVEARFPNPLALPADELWRSIHACLFSIIIHCQPSLLQYFVDAFGVEVVKLILKDRNFSAAELDYCKDVKTFLKRDPLIFLPMHLQLEIKLQISKPVVKYNTFAVLMMNENKQGEKFRWVVRKMLALIGEYGFAENMSEMIFERGLKCLIPSYMRGKVEKDCVTELINFFKGEHKEIFRNSIRKAFLQPGGVWSCVYENVELYDLIQSLSDGLVERSELSSMIRENPDFFRFWTKTLRCCELSVVTKVWAYVEMALANKEEQLEFITKSEIGGNSYDQPRLVNALTMAALNTDSLIINFVWELAILLMNKNNYTDWLNQSFIRGEPYDTRSLPLKLFNFLAKLISSGSLTEDELGDMILSKDENGKCYFMMLINNSITRDNILIHYLYNFLSQYLRSRAGNILTETKPVFWNMLTYFRTDECCLAEEWSDIEEEFKNIVSCNTFGLIDEILEDDYSVFGSTKKNKELKFCVVLCYKAIKLESECLGRKLFFERMKCDHLGYGNFFIYFISWKNPPMFSCLCEILMKFVESEDMMQYLYLVNNHGNNVFHEAAREKDYHLWGKVYDVARILLKEMALSEIHSIPNKSGYHVHDLFSKCKWLTLMEKM